VDSKHDQDKPWVRPHGERGYQALSHAAMLQPSFAPGDLS
jgi:hypothetical protein